MAGGRHRGSVAPHLRAVRAVRQSRTRGRRLALAPWIVVAVVVVLLLSGMSFGYFWFAQSGCDGTPTTITVVSSPDQFKTISSLAQEWQQSEPELDGKCIGATVERKESAEVAAALSPNWDPRRDGPRPDVWTPDSSAWHLVASDRPDGAAMIPAKWPRLASSPVVIAMPKPMAEALKWPDASLSWRDLITTFGAGKTWADFASCENWGKFRIGMTNPASSTAGLHSLFAITDFNNDDEVSDEELKSGLVFERGVTTYVSDTNKLFEGLTKEDAVSRENALVLHLRVPGPGERRLGLQRHQPQGAARADLPQGGHGRRGLPVHRAQGPLGGRHAPADREQVLRLPAQRQPARRHTGRLASVSRTAPPPTRRP